MPQLLVAATTIWNVRPPGDMLRFLPPLRPPWVGPCKHGRRQERRWVGAQPAAAGLGCWRVRAGAKTHACHRCRSVGLRGTPARLLRALVFKSLVGSPLGAGPLESDMYKMPERCELPQAPQSALARVPRGSSCTPSKTGSCIARDQCSFRSWHWRHCTPRVSPAHERNSGTRVSCSWALQDPLLTTDQLRSWEHQQQGAMASELSRFIGALGTAPLRLAGPRWLTSAYCLLRSEARRTPSSPPGLPPPPLEPPLASVPPPLLAFNPPPHPAAHLPCRVPVQRMSCGSRASRTTRSSAC